jgi:hypothetical protein
MKAFAVVAEINEVLVKHRVQAVTVKASGLGMAAHKAWQEIKKRDGVKKKRISKVKFSIVAVEDGGIDDRSDATSSGV